MRIGIIAMFLNMVMNVVFYLSGMAHVGLALATSIAAFVNAGLLFFGLVKERVFFFQSGWIRYAIQLFFANLILAIFLIYYSSELSIWLNWQTGTKILQLGILVFGGIVIYFVALFVLGLRWRHIHR